jgi:hypothetical protein
VIPDVPIFIALAAGGLALAAIEAVMTAGAVRSGGRKVGSSPPRGLVGNMIGTTIVLAIPLGVAACVSIPISALLIAAGTPPIAYPFVSLAGLAGLRAALEHPSGGMEGCNRIIGTLASAYAIAWGGVAWWATGGPAALPADLAALRPLQPPLAALPVALLVTRLAGRKRTLFLFLGTLAFFSAYLALGLFPIQAGFAAAWLPRSDWLRFPLAAVAEAAVIAAIPFALKLAVEKRRRLRVLRRLPRGALLVAAVAAPIGLAWAAAGAALALLAPA